MPTWRQPTANDAGMGGSLLGVLLSAACARHRAKVNAAKRQPATVSMQPYQPSPV